MKTICTSNYNNCKTENGISISGDRGNKVNFKGSCLPILAPKKEFYEIWHNNIGKISNEENNRYYITEYYNQVLSKLDPKQIYDMIPKEGILLCYENNNEFCHRHLVAFWLELFLGIRTFEVYENPKRETRRVVERPEYLKSVLEDIIKENYDMHDFNSIKDAYEYNKKSVKRLNLVI